MSYKPKESFEKKVFISNPKGASVTSFGENPVSKCTRGSQILVTRGKARR